MSGKSAVPGPGSLLQSVEALVETAHKIWTSDVNKTIGLCAVNSLIQSTMEEGVLDVKLMNWPIERESNCQNFRMVAGLTTGLKVSAKSTPGR
jgi:hypothetical protein